MNIIGIVACRNAFTQEASSNRYPALRLDTRLATLTSSTATGLGKWNIAAAVSVNWPATEP